MLLCFFFFVMKNTIIKNYPYYIELFPLSIFYFRIALDLENQFIVVVDRSESLLLEERYI